MYKLYKTAIFSLFTFFISCTSKHLSNNTIKYYKNGNIESIKVFNSSNNTYQFIMFNRDGSIINIDRSLDSVDYLVDGQVDFFNPNGNIMKIMTYKNRQQTGLIYDFTPDGAIMGRQYEVNKINTGYKIDYDSVGLVFGESIFDSSGNLIDMKHIRNGCLLSLPKEQVEEFDSMYKETRKQMSNDSY